MTNNREQHELAARAAGLLLLWKTGSCKGGEFEAAFVGDQPWRPKEDDGDAFRLGVKLGLKTSVGYDIGLVFCRPNDSNENEVWEPLGKNDPCAATRLAIFRAAVEIGKAMT